MYKSLIPANILGHKYWLKKWPQILMVSSLLQCVQFYTSVECLLVLKRTGQLRKGNLYHIHGFQEAIIPSILFSSDCYCDHVPLRRLFSVHTSNYKVNNCKHVTCKIWAHQKIGKYTSWSHLKLKSMGLYDTLIPEEHGQE